MSADPEKARTREQIDENLRRVYDQLLREDVPDRFKELLAQLRDQKPKP